MKTEVKVGAFVLASLTILTFTLIYLMTTSSHTGSVPYKTYLHYAGGLEAGAPVLFGASMPEELPQCGPGQLIPPRSRFL
jgi:ABC-type transporter Mla subunit MlaD